MEQCALGENLSNSLKTLARCLDRTVGLVSTSQRLGSITLYRAIEPLSPAHVLCTPLLCVVAQGRREVTLGDETYSYEPGQIFLNSLPVPLESATINASREHPCLWMTIELQSALVDSVVAEAGLDRCFLPVKTLETSPIDVSIVQALTRLVDLFETPSKAEFIAPLILREIVYRLLIGDQGDRLRQIAFVDAPPHPVLRAVEWLNQHYSQPLVVQNLAREAGMSPSSLHQHFKNITGLSPLQYQRQMRLQEALRLMTKEYLDAANAGYRVGYDDPSHFSREYRRFFGAPPRRHVESLRQPKS